MEARHMTISAQDSRYNVHSAVQSSKDNQSSNALHYFFHYNLAPFNLLQRQTIITHLIYLHFSIYALRPCLLKKRG